MPHNLSGALSSDADDTKIADEQIAVRGQISLVELGGFAAIGGVPVKRHGAFYAYEALPRAIMKPGHWHCQARHGQRHAEKTLFAAENGVAVGGQGEGKGALGDGELAAGH